MIPYRQAADSIHAFGVILSCQIKLQSQKKDRSGTVFLIRSEVLVCNLTIGEKQKEQTHKFDIVYVCSFLLF